MNPSKKYKYARNALLGVIGLLAILFSLREINSTKEWHLPDGSVKTYREANNYMIYKGVFEHTLKQTNLYLTYSDEYTDKNHYGPLFSLVIAPFALLPDSIGVVFWVLANIFFLIYALNYIPITSKGQFLLLLLLVNDFANSAINTQINVSIAAMLVLAFVFTIKEKPQWATFFIFLGVFIKIYTIVGLAFFLFSKQKLKFIGYSVMWTVVFFVLPMLISSPQFIIQTYADWYHELVDKNSHNIVSTMQDVSLQGALRAILKNNTMATWPFFVFGSMAYLIPFVRYRQFKFEGFRYLMLISTLIFPVVFSSGSESPTYIIAVTGIGLWAILFLNPKNKMEVSLLIIAILLTILSSTDFYPYAFRSAYLYPYKVKAIGAFLIWIYVIYKSLTVKFDNFKLNHYELTN